MKPVVVSSAKFGGTYRGSLSLPIVYVIGITKLLSGSLHVVGTEIIEHKLPEIINNKLPEIDK